MATPVLMPRQGQSVESCILVEWTVAPNDKVEKGQIVANIETDKATFEIEAPEGGSILELFAEAGDDIPVLTTIAAIGEEGEDASALRPDGASAPAGAAEEAGAGEAAPAEPTPVAESAAAAPVAPVAGAGVSPRARNAAAVKGVDPATLQGTGPGGRVIERDVVAAQAVSPAAQARAAAEGLAVPSVGSGIGGRVLAADLVTVAPEAVGVAVAAMEFPGNSTEIPVKGVRKIVAERMQASLQNTAQLTLNASADARAMLAYRKKCKAAPEERGVGGINITDFVLYATVKTLTEFPEFNAHWQGDKIVQFENVHLGLAVDTPRGLSVPVIRYANLMSLKQLSAEAKRVAKACFDGTIEPDELIGGTFTVTNIGSMGIESFTPVLNAPEVGILGACATQPKPVMQDGEVQFIPHMGLSLTIDHSAVDGAPGARFLASLREKLAAFDLTLAG